MKTKLLLLYCLFAFSAFAQSPIQAFYGTLAFDPGIDGTNFRSYAVAISAIALDQSATGADITWDFNLLTAVGTSTYNNVVPTSGEISTYPNTNMITVVVSTIGATTTTSSIASDTAANSFSFTGVASTELNLNYSGNNGTIGNFPLAYGYTNTDAIAGTYSYDIYSGNFSGNLVTSVDAYGTLSTNDVGFGPISYPVTRLKTVQTITLSYGIFTNAGTVVQTTYHYYRTADLFPLFKSTTTSIVVPLLSIDQTNTTLEEANPNLTMGTHESGLQRQLQIIPNPVTDRLSIQAGNNLEILAVKIMDVNGKTMATDTYNGESLNVGHLAKGIYFAEITTDAGKATKKIIKN